jgi:hypothetical protein
MLLEILLRYKQIPCNQLRVDNPMNFEGNWIRGGSLLDFDLSKPDEVWL